MDQLAVQHKGHNSYTFHLVDTDCFDLQTTWLTKGESLVNMDQGSGRIRA